MTSSRALVVGAGIGGLATAAALLDTGIEVIVVEHRKTPEQDGTAIYLPGNGMRAAAQLGIADELSAQGFEVTSQLLLGPDGTVLSRADLAATWGGIAPCVALRRAHLHQALRCAATRAEIRYGVTVDCIEQSAAGVSIGLSDGSEARCDFVVGADGIHSQVRALAFPRAPAPEFSGESYWRAIVPRPDRVDAWTGTLVDDGVFLLLPLGSDIAYVAASRFSDRPVADPVPGRADRLRSRFAHLASPAADALRSLPDDPEIHYAAVESVFVDDPARGRCVLVGDAAHANPPHMAQGACLALEDAVVLADELRRTGDVPAALARYSRRRLPRTRHVRDDTEVRRQVSRIPMADRLPLVASMFSDSVLTGFAPLQPEP